MAFTKKTAHGVQVRQGNTNEVLATFRGAGAAQKAATKVAQLHKTNHPKASNRGASAAKKFR